MKIITGYKGEAHITSNEIQGENQGIFGTGSYVMNVGNKFSPTLISANELQISDGEGVIQGVHFRVDPGTYDSVTIENGAQGMNRKDLVVCRYTKDAETGVEQTEWVVKKGTATSGTATRPSATSGNIRTGSTLAEMAMFEIVLSGINVTAVNPLFSVLKSMKELLDLENELNTNMTPADVTNQISLTKGTNCGAVTLQTAYKCGHLLFLKFTVTPSASVSSGGSVDIGISGCTPIMGADFRLMYGVIGTVMFTSWMANNTTIRCRRMASDAWATNLSPIISGIILCSD